VAEHACSGSHGAAPIARELIKTYLQKFYPDLYSDRAIEERKQNELKEGGKKRVSAPAQEAGD
jgi:hypothetical protein